ncbi:hypothetical protein ACUXQE_002690 [Staphylococcus saprophyticus]
MFVFSIIIGVSKKSMYLMLLEINSFGSLVWIYPYKFLLIKRAPRKFLLFERLL